jgi:hypothetical protein
MTKGDKIKLTTADLGDQCYFVMGGTVYLNTKPHKMST